MDRLTDGRMVCLVMRGLDPRIHQKESSEE
jgi:hypothetical protein